MSDIPHQGWVLRHENGLAGFLGIIPADYASQGERMPALIATSWVIAPEHRNAAVPMAMHLQRLAKTYLLLDTTPSAEVQAIITRVGWHGELKARRVLVPMGLAGRALARVKGRPWPRLPAGRRITTDVHEVKRLVRAWQWEDRLEKWITPEGLRWYGASPSRQHQFVGVVDAEGTLSSYLWLTPKSRQGLTWWSLLEAFSTEADDGELEAMVGALVRKKITLPGPPAVLLSLMSFPQDSRWADVPGVKKDEVDVCHFHLSPPSMKRMVKHTVMAEGDYGL
ncbi:hypothetical protein [Prosthecobacter sp. SYSU 5D2]|uniref:hypothetical protein n=1 Tax=Prosthecobacter sp. SYSU 5D2 TaxID=3134134 RepID=UPI0031FEA079